MNGLPWPIYIALVVIPATLALFTIIVFVHEMGHFLVARWCRVKVDAFSVGFGKELAGVTDKHGTRWKLSMFPLGGYVKFTGDANAASFPQTGEAAIPGSLESKKLWQRALIVAAGPIANFLLAIAIFSGMFWWLGEQVPPPRVDQVQPGSAAESAGIKPGDMILKADGQVIDSFNDMVMYVAVNDSETIKLEIKRGSEVFTIPVTPKLETTEDDLQRKIQVRKIGLIHDFKNGPEATKFYSGPAAIKRGAHQTWQIISMTGSMLKRLVTGRESLNRLSGPIGNAERAGRIVTYGLTYYISLIAILSVSIGMINLLPIPVLDGGHLLFFGLEAVMGRPPGPKAREWSLRFGISIIMFFYVFVIMNDVFQLWIRNSGS